MINQWYTQIEMDYDETFVLVAILDAIRILLAYAYNKNIVWDQIDVKSTFKNRNIK